MYVELSTKNLLLNSIILITVKHLRVKVLIIIININSIIIIRINSFITLICTWTVVWCNNVIIKYIQ